VNIFCDPDMAQAISALRCMTIRFLTFSTELGTFLVGSCPAGVCFLQCGGSPDSLLTQLTRQFPDEALVEAPDQERSDLTTVQEAVLTALRGEDIPVDTFTLAPRGTEFQKMVWSYLRSIPAGEVRSYSEVAHALEIPRSSRAIANACGANSIALLIPCHRVVRRDGLLGGYRWGAEIKRRLLAVEKAGRLVHSHAHYQGFNVTSDIPDTI
jgi:AraC family transcriptional regulator of adaptative response/methylated-DNA-[protein]-cysteine methyltransferase